MPGTDAYVFDPSKNTNDFTVAGCFSADDLTVESRALMAKYNSVTLDKRCWIAYQDGPDFKFAVSKDGASGNTEIVLTNSVVIDDETFFCGRYDYVADGTSDIFLRVNDATTSNLNAVGPIFFAEGADVQIADYDTAAVEPANHFDGKAFWLAYWNRKLTDAETENLRKGLVHPASLAPDFYWDGHQAVAGTYISERPLDPRYWKFDVEGTPVKGGSALEALLGPIGSVGLELGISNPMTAGMLTVDPRATSLPRGNVDLGRPPKDGALAATHLRPVPRASALHRGLVEILKHQRNRGK
jgi:hypothetical protein